MDIYLKILIPVLLMIPINTDDLLIANKQDIYIIDSKINKFDIWTTDLYYQIGLNSLDLQVFKFAMKGYMKMLDSDKLKNKDIISIIDFSKTSKNERLFIIDIKNKKLLLNELVAHGTKSGVEYAKYFSNKKQSNQSSLGFYVTGKTYIGKNGFSLKLHGQEIGFNSKAFERGIVLHGAKYVSEDFVKKNGRLGRSFGCPAVDLEKNKLIINTIKNGTCFFIYYPSEEYLKQSNLIN